MSSYPYVYVAYQHSAASREQPVCCMQCVSFRPGEEGELTGRCGRFLDARVFRSFGCKAFAPSTKALGFRFD